MWMDEGVDMDVDEGVYMTCVAKMYVHAYIIICGKLISILHSNEYVLLHAF